MTSVLTAGAPPRQALRYQLDSGVGLLTPSERAARGKEARAALAGLPRRGWLSGSRSVPSSSVPSSGAVVVRAVVRCRRGRAASPVPGQGVER